MTNLRIPTGKFRFYHMDSAGGRKVRLLGVLKVDEDSTEVVLDPKDYLLGHFPDGPQNIQKFKRWYSLTTNPYFCVCWDRSAQEPDRGMWGLLVGDAVGVPYEFKKPEELPDLRHHISLPAPDGYARTYPQVPNGWWSDDGAQALALLQTIRNGFSAKTFADELLAWLNDGRYMPQPGPPFDCGIATRQALQRYANTKNASTCGLDDERSNGNGSLMRCLPVAVAGPEDDFAAVEMAHQQSTVTHAHPRSQVCCAFYTLWARQVMRGSPNPVEDAHTALLAMYTTPHLRQFLHELVVEVRPLDPLTRPPAGYVVDSLRAAIQANRETDYARVIRHAIALGYDTDTNAAIAGGIAGLRFGAEEIPAPWFDLVRQHNPAGLV